MLRRYQLLTIKIGTEVLHDGRSACHEAFQHIAAQAATLIDGGTQVVIVSSAAVAFGREYVERLRSDAPGSRQWRASSMAGLGQPELMLEWKRAFEPFRIPVAQLMVTHANMVDELELGNIVTSVVSDYYVNRAIVIVNENDLVSHDEMSGIRKGALFSDNDMLAVHMTLALMEARDLSGDETASFFVTSNRGLYDPRFLKDGERVWLQHVDHATLKVMLEETGEKTTGGRGGARTKALALLTARSTGVHVGVGGYQEILPFVEGAPIRGTLVGDSMAHHIE